MQTASFRYIVVITVLLAGAGLYAAFGEPNANVAPPRWPETPALYAIDTWTTTDPVVEHNTDAGRKTDLVTRTFRKTTGTVATLTLVTSQAPKLYGAGAEVPFLGTGYTVVPPPSEVAGVLGDGANALIARRGTEQWLVMYGYGERRGMLGNGPLPWALATLDGITGQANDYYKLYLTTRNDQLDPRAASDLAELSRALFPRIVAWYAA